MKFIFALSALLWADLPYPISLIKWDPGLRETTPSFNQNQVNVKDFGAKGDGITDDQPAFESALASLEKPGTLYIPTGTYFLNNTLKITEDSVLIKGDGPTKTFLNFATSTNASIEILTYGRGNWQALTSSIQRGEQSIEVVDGTKFKVGDFAEIQKENDPELMYTKAEWNQSYAQNAPGQILEIEKIEGNHLYFKHYLYLDYPTNQGSEIRPQRLLKHVGLESFKIKRTGYESDVYTIFWKNTAFAWAKDLESEYTRKAHIGVESSYGCQVENNYFHHSYSYGGGGHGYGTSLGFHTTDCLIENNIFTDLRHSMIIAKGASGNVFGYNFSTNTIQKEDGASVQNEIWLSPDISIHGHWSNHNLFESNVVQQIDIADHWGPTGPGVLYLRNKVVNDILRSDGKAEEGAIRLQDASNFQSIIGNYIEKGELEITDPGIDLNNTLIHGNFSSQKTQWDPLIESRYIPISHYWNCKPSFIENNPWPSIGPENNGIIPAEIRYETKQYFLTNSERTCSAITNNLSPTYQQKEFPKKTFKVNGQALEKNSFQPYVEIPAQ